MDFYERIAAALITTAVMQLFALVGLLSWMKYKISSSDKKHDLFFAHTGDSSIHQRSMDKELIHEKFANLTEKIEKLSAVQDEQCDKIDRIGLDVQRLLAIANGKK